jgi:formylglycine-generating enzyme required for sulfatase activity
MAQCSAKTKGGKPCQNSVKEGQKFCHVHRNQRLVRLVSAGVAILGVVSGIVGILDYLDIKPFGNKEQIIIVNPTATPAKDEMILIPAGSFLMGADPDAPFNPWYGEYPQHEVNLSSFMISKTEVTNLMYRQCVYEDACESPIEVSSSTRDDYFTNAQFNSYPVVNITWAQAENFCRWMGQRLPTEAEWEYAARGTSGNLFPWGNTPPNCSLANYQGCNGDTVPVGSYSSGVSPFGLFDMAGNVNEWVSDWMGEGYYYDSPVDNPPGPDSGMDHIIRGGGWTDPMRELRSTSRGGMDPGKHDSSVGFRCVMVAE